MAQLGAAGRVAGEEHRDPIAERLLQGRIGIDIDHHDVRTPQGGQRPHRVQHLVAEVAAVPPQKGQLQRLIRRC